MIYRMALPVLFFAAFPGWIVKMLRRGGFGTRLGERAAIYRDPPEFEPCGTVHLHAVSVGESLLALKLIRAWRSREPERRFVLATGTATGHAVATAAKVDDLRVTYAPLDFRSMVRRYLDRFEPSRIVLMEGEAWPHLLIECERRGIPVSLVNARMSPRSARRYRRVAPRLRPLFGRLSPVAVQETGDAAVWRDLGVAPDRIRHTGSLKFDPGGGAIPVRRPAFQSMLDAFGRRPVVLAASTHAGEDAWIAQAIRDAAPTALIVLAPRHAERRNEVAAELARAGFTPLLRSTFTHASGDPSEVLVIDSTGELRDWTAHADAVIIGKSFLASGGQNPTEAILANKPLVFGPHMENFEPLASRLADCGGAIRSDGGEALRDAIRAALDPLRASKMTAAATALIRSHEGATERVIDLFLPPETPPK
ncbi:MAG: 3-deoxy-D-manno-octulosonic acid transferase [Alphaproteobacteria bacterium]